MAIILCIDTATEVCSVAVSRNGNIDNYTASETGNTHAEDINILIEKILGLSGICFQDLDAVAVSMGPGSYTSLRVGAATVKAIALALNIPIIGIGTLEQLARKASESHSGIDYIIPMIDARRMEVYTSTYSGQMEMVEEAQSIVLDENTYESTCMSNVLFVGNGAFKVRNFTMPESWIIMDVSNTADQLAALAEEYYQKKLFISAIKFSPIYLKNPNITQSKRELF